LVVLIEVLRLAEREHPPLWLVFKGKKIELTGRLASLQCSTIVALLKSVI
jgi:hypothetical protein